MYISAPLYFHMESSNWFDSDSLSSYTREHIYQTLDSKAPLDSQYTAGEMLKSEIVIILDIGHSKGVLCQNNESYFSSGN